MSKAQKTKCSTPIRDRLKDNETKHSRLRGASNEDKLSSENAIGAPDKTESRKENHHAAKKRNGNKNENEKISLARESTNTKQ
jgi:hypothetical protein